MKSYRFIATGKRCTRSGENRISKLPDARIGSEYKKYGG